MCTEHSLSAVKVIATHGGKCLNNLGLYDFSVKRSEWCFHLFSVKTGSAPLFNIMESLECGI